MESLTCYFCKKTEKSIQHLVRHVKIHKILPYKCSAENCQQKEYTNIESFRSHIKRHGRINPAATRVNQVVLEEEVPESNGE